MALLLPLSTKVHREFDLKSAEAIFSRTVPADDLTGELITSPYDLYAVETLRRRHQLNQGESYPTDVFVFGKGEPENPAATKLGGRPFWPADQKWPKRRDGSPCYFLAQINFADSLDLVGDIPETLLLLLTDSEKEWMWDDQRIQFVWVSGKVTPAMDIEVPSAIGKSGPFWGAIHRTADYPESSDAAYALQIDQGYCLPVLNGTKIGGLPHFIQGDSEKSGRFLCQIGSVQAEPDVSFPWVNEPKPLGLYGSSNISSETNSAIFADMGNIYLFLNDDGTVSYHMDSY